MSDKTWQFAVFLVTNHYRNTLETMTAESDEAEKLDVYTYATNVIAQRLQTYWAHWQQHPDFLECNRLVPQEPHNPTVTGVWVHAPGHHQITESYVFASVQDILSPATQRWGARIFGTFSHLEPIDHSIPIDVRYRQHISNSLRSGGQAYHARMELKRLLPPELRKYISLLRHVVAQPKYHHLQNDLGFAKWQAMSRKERNTLIRTPSLQPEWYRCASKAQLWAKSLPDQERRQISAWINPVDLYLCAAGEAHPDDVKNYVVHQIPLFTF